MSAPASIHTFLGDAHVPYTVLPHRPAFTAQEEAAALHVPGRDWAKVVVCIADGVPIQAVLPAHLAVNLDRLRLSTGAAVVRFAFEHELRALYPDCELGAMPPFGPLYGHRVFVDASLTKEPEIVFNAGTHRDAIRMRYPDFVAAAKPIVGHFAERPVQRVIDPIRRALDR
jgi:Ala-tRNA(Pro) deacylase